MLYLAILLVTALALVIFLHNDHDRSYDKKERRITVAPEQPTVKQKAQPKPTPKPPIAAIRPLLSMPINLTHTTA